MKSLLLVLAVVVVVTMLGCGGGGGEPTPPTTSRWSVGKYENVLQFAYGSGTDYVQYGALHTDSGYFRLVNSKTTGWGTSVVVTPSFWEEVGDHSMTWEEISPPESVTKLICDGDTLFAGSTSGSGAHLYKSLDKGSSWQPITFGSGWLLDYDVDRGSIWVSRGAGYSCSIDLSEDGGTSFRPSFWSPDGATGIDFENGYGWAAVTSFGSKSGMWRKTPESLEWQRDEILTWSVRNVVIDRLDPKNCAYSCQYQAGGYGGVLPTRTMDGSSWSCTWTKRVDFSAVVDGRSVVYATDAYSNDHGSTWQPLGLLAQAFGQAPNGTMYVGTASQGLFTGKTGAWTNLGLIGKDIVSVSATDNNVYVSTKEGKVFRAKIEESRTSPASGATPIYHQGCPVTATWKEEGEKLNIRFSGNVYGLETTGEISLLPPQKGIITASVTVSTSGDIHLADKPNEAFKPVMLSSMHISDTQWDCIESFIGSFTNAIPNAGALVPSPVPGREFGLKGGTSSWKTNAPTVTITLENQLPVTGWVTASSDPNDDNVAMWPGSDTVLRSWSYTIKAQAK